MKERLRRFWLAFWSDPLVEYRRAKAVLARGLAGC